MKLNWFSPLPPAATGIAEYTGTLLPWLSAKAEVTLWTDQTTWSPGLEAYCKVRRYSPERIAWPEVNAADLSVFHIGNNRDHHYSLWQVSRVHAGVVVVHDLRLQDFFWNALADTRDPAGEYIALMKGCYGAAGESAAKSLVLGVDTLDRLCVRYPLTEAAIQNATAAVVHTSGGFDLLAEHCRAPLAELPFPYAAANAERFSAWNERRRKAPTPPFQVVMCGYINPNRRLVSVLQALSEVASAGLYHLRVYGPIWDEPFVKAKVREYGLERCVTLHGFCAASLLDAAIADADLAINLRYPSMGEASMSQLQLWDHALPSIVTRTGWYAGLPESAVMFVEMDREIESLKGHLTAFAANPSAFTQWGTEGRALLSAQHDPERYVEHLLGFFEQALHYRAALAVVKSARQCGISMQGWMNDAAVNREADFVGNRLAQLVR